MKQSIVLFCDILGFSNLIDLTEGADNTKTLELIKKALREGLKIIKIFTDDKTEPDKIKYKIFSDNLFISINYDPENKKDFSFSLWLLILISRVYQETMLKNMILVRGGISFGGNYIDDEIIFSPALIKAYQIESKIANYPRIVLDTTIVEIIKNGIILPEIIAKTTNDAVIHDWTNTYFVNPFNTRANYCISDTTPENLKIEDRETKKFILNFISGELRREEIKKNRILYEKNLWLFELLGWIIMDEKKDVNIKLNKLTFSFLKVELSVVP